MKSKTECLHVLCWERQFKSLNKHLQLSCSSEIRKMFYFSASWYILMRMVIKKIVVNKIKWISLHLYNQVRSDLNVTKFEKSIVSWEVKQPLEWKQFGRSLKRIRATARIFFRCWFFHGSFHYLKKAFQSH